MENSNIVTLVLLIMCALLGGVIYSITAFYVQPLKNKLKNRISDIELLKSMYKHKEGYTRLYNNQSLDYHLITMDGGHVWYAIDRVKYNSLNNVVILGEVETVYPGLMRHLEIWSDISKSIQRGGCGDDMFVEHLVATTLKENNTEITKKSL